MKLVQLRLNYFRNLAATVLTCGERFNILHGANGQGKTNLLEAVFLLGTLKSFRQARTAELLAWNQPAATISGLVDKDGLQRKIQLQMERHSKRVLVDDKPVSRLADFFGVFTVVAFSPEELYMVRGTPENRRRYLDRAIFSGDGSYLRLYHDYFRILKNRNLLLKQRNFADLPVWTEQLAVAGARLMGRRAAYLAELAPNFADFYRRITGSDEEADLCYHAQPFGPGPPEGDFVSRMRGELARRETDERQRGMTLVGPHRDDLDFFLNGRQLKAHGSQGQLKSFILALKMAEIDHLQRRTGTPPVLLLDDMTAELDETRNRHLLQFLRERAMQVFITTTDPANIPLNESTACTTFRVEGGRLLQ
jgi:DNA replication and repair protein RecF